MAAHLGHGAIQAVADPIDIEWSLDALADLDRFATFLHTQHIDLARRVALELTVKADVLRQHPTLGRPLMARTDYRELVMRVLGGAYALQYRYDGRSVLMLRVFHSREAR